MDVIEPDTVFMFVFIGNMYKIAGSIYIPPFSKQGPAVYPKPAITLLRKISDLMVAIETGGNGFSFGRTPVITEDNRCARFRAPVYKNYISPAIHECSCRISL